MMFGHAFFGSAFFGPRYFGVGGLAGDPEPEPEPVAPAATAVPTYGERRRKKKRKSELAEEIREQPVTILPLPDPNAAVRAFIARQEPRAREVSITALGPEPIFIDRTAERLAEQAAKRKRRMKLFLLLN